MSATAETDAILSGILLLFSFAIIVLIVVILLGLRRTARPVLKVRLFLGANRLERAFLALLASFVVFVFIAIPQALAWATSWTISVFLLSVHLGLITYAFLEFHLTIRAPRGILNDGRK